MKILFVDDDPSSHVLLEEQLLTLDQDFYGCYDVDSVLRACRQTHYDIFILDLGLPEMETGLTLCRTLRSMSQTRQSLILILTGQDQDESLEAALDAGADDYLNKPVNLQQLNIRLTILERRLGDLLRRQQAEQILTQQARLLLGVAGAMNYLLIIPDFEEAILLALKTLSLNVDVDRMYIYETEFHPDTQIPLMSQRFAWDRFTEESTIRDPEFQQIPYYPDFKRWYELLNSEQTVSGRMQELSSEEKDMLASQNIMSFLLVPITIQENFWGFIGFDDCRKEREWRDEETFLLMAMAGSIGGAIAREHSERKLRQTSTELREVFQALPDEYFRLGPDGKILDYKLDTASQLDLYSESFIGKWASGRLPDEAGRNVEAAMKQVRATQQPQHIEYSVPQDGKGPRYEEIRFLPFLDNQVIVVARDITQWKTPKEQELSV